MTRNHSKHNVIAMATVAAIGCTVFTSDPTHRARVITIAKATVMPSCGHSQLLE